MSGSFAGLSIASSSLFLNQRGLEVTGKNIANANTVGYTRQRMVTQPAAHDLGVELVTVEQVRDQFLDTQYRNENSALGEWNVKTDALTSLEDFFQEPSENGLNQAIGDFFNSVQEMSNSPEEKAMRSQVRQNALKLTDTLHYLYQKFTEMQQGQDQSIESSVSQINTLAKGIQTLNGQIQKAETTGQKANELRDQRNILIDQMSEMVNVKVTDQSDGSVSVMIGNQFLVDKTDVNLLTVSKDKTNPIDGEGLLNSIKWANGDEVTISGGKLKGYLDIRDGQGVAATDNPQAMGIPYFVKQLNLLAKTVAKSVNDLHKTGYTMPNESNGNTSQTGIYFFNPTDAENDVTAKSIKLSDDVMNNVYNIAASGKSITTTNSGNNELIKQIAALRDLKNLTISDGTNSYNIGSLEGYTKEIISDLAITSADATKMLEGQEVLTNSVEGKRSSVSGVSMDEEMTNMIQFQHAYSAAARVITVIDKNLDTLINQMGR